MSWDHYHASEPPITLTRHTSMQQPMNKCSSFPVCCRQPTDTGCVHSCYRSTRLQGAVISCRRARTTVTQWRSAAPTCCPRSTASTWASRASSVPVRPQSSKCFWGGGGGLLVHGLVELPVYQYVHSLVNAYRAGVTVTIRCGSGLLRVTDDCPKCWVGILVCKFDIASLSILKLL